MHNSIAYKFCIFKSCDKRKYSFLLTKFKVCLKAHKVIHTSLCVLCTKLNDGIRSIACSWICQTYRLQRTETHCVLTTFCKDLNRHTALVNFEAVLRKMLLIKIMERSGFRIDKFIIEPEIFFLIHRAVYIISFSLAVSRSKKHLILIKTFICDDRCGGIMKIQIITAYFADTLCKLIACKRTCCDYNIAIRYICDFFLDNSDVRIFHYLCRDHIGKLFPINSKCSAC